MIVGCLAVLGIAFMMFLAVLAFVEREIAVGVIMAALSFLSIRKFIRYCKGERKKLKLVKNVDYAGMSVHDMSGVTFERYCGALLMNNGYRNVLQTQASNDYGADLIAVNENGEKCVFQCKRYSGTVDNSAVQEVVASKRHYGATVAGIMTNSVLTANARELAQDNGVIVYENIR